MKLRYLNILICALALLPMLAACKHENTEKAPDVATVHECKNGIYYWRTVLRLDSAERAFLGAHNVKRAYVRFFDIVVDKSPAAMDAVVPNATLQVKDSLPVEEIIPTVYITVDALKKMKGDEDRWAQKMVKRVANMCSYNELPALQELQLDCDWTLSTDSVFFALCKAVKRELAARNPEAVLSATIRLHQLRQTPPPVDYGVLMLYNTGSFENPETPNSILSVADVQPYLGHLADYPLPLDNAYPVFSWNLLYRDQRFKGIMRSDTELPRDILKYDGYNTYMVECDTIIDGTFFYARDMIRREEIPFTTLMEVKDLVDSLSGGRAHSNVIYHLDTRNLANYTGDEFTQIYK